LKAPPATANTTAPVNERARRTCTTVGMGELRDEEEGSYSAVTAQLS
jgi:hypothetical protein